LRSSAIAKRTRPFRIKEGAGGKGNEERVGERKFCRMGIMVKRWKGGFGGYPCVGEEMGLSKAVSVATDGGRSGIDDGWSEADKVTKRLNGDCLYHWEFFV
jgi:hypothetical protein